LKENKILCSICYDSTITLLLEPCNHICICQLCYNSLISNDCPICKTKILATKKIYFANHDN
jgi:Zinc finger, C3HC4 type (RING finger)